MTKAKYMVLVDHMKYYTYVTTTRNTENMIDILVDRFQMDDTRQLVIYRKMEGETQIVYSLKPVKDERIPNFG